MEKEAWENKRRHIFFVPKQARWSILFEGFAVAEDVKLRQLIRKTLLEKTKLLDSIAQMKQELEKAVFDIVRANKDSLIDESNVESTLTEPELKNYMISVLNEIDQQRSSK